MKRKKTASEYKTYALSGRKKTDKKSGTTIPGEEAVIRMRNWSIENKQ